MASFNKVILMGNLTRDPQLKFLPSGTPVCEFGLATNRRWTDATSGQTRETTMFVDCSVMGKQAEVVSRNFNKGKPILIDGRLDYRQWTTPNGEKRSKHEIIVENFSFVGTAGAGGGPGGGDGEGGGGGPPRGRYGPPARQQQQGMDGPPPDMGDGGGAPGPDDVPF